jgi:hypothetical protein
VIATMKSHAGSAWAWLRTNVLQAGDRPRLDECFDGGPDGNVPEGCGRRVDSHLGPACLCSHLVAYRVCDECMFSQRSRKLSDGSVSVSFVPPENVANSG